MPSNLPLTLVNQQLSQQYDFILASASPRRRELLAHMGLPFRVVLPENGAGVDETPRPGETPAELVQRLSQVKAQAVAASLPQFYPRDELAPIPVIIAADTEVVLAGQILGKPATPAEAVEMLKALRAHSYHEVCSGVTVATPANAAWKLVTRLHRSQVWMRAYSDAEIESYVASGDPLDKAGAYAIQHERFAPVARLDGCFASVMGLPLGELAAALSQFGIILAEIASLCRSYSGWPCCQQ
jgi:septum formation protein